MKSRMFKLSVIIISIIIISGCSTTKKPTVLEKTGGQSFVVANSSSFYVDIINPKFEADVEIGKEKISGEAEVIFLAGFFPISLGNKFYCGTPFTYNFNPLEKLSQSMALYEIYKEHDIDFLVAPTYDFKINSYIFLSVIKAKVKGFPGKYKGFKPISLEKQKEYGITGSSKAIYVK